MKGKLLPALQAVCAVVLLGAIKIWAPVCSGLLDLANETQTHMKCWYSGQAVMCIAVIIGVMAALSIFMDKAPRKLMQIAVIVACFMMMLVVGPAIGICAKAEMACHATAKWVHIIGAVIAIIGVADIFSGKENQLPD